MSRLADDASGVALVDHDECIVLLGKVTDAVDRSDIAVHGEDTIGDNDAEALGLCLLEAVLKLLHVGIGVAVALGFAEAHTVDDGGMVECIADDGIFLGEERFEDSAVGIEAGGIEDGVVGVEIAGDGLLELLVDVLCATDEAYAGHAESATVHHLLGCLDESGMIGESEIIVCAEVEHFLASDLNSSLLRTADETFLLIESCLANLGQRLAEMFFHLSVHSRIGFNGLLGNDCASTRRARWAWSCSALRHQHVAARMPGRQQRTSCSRP